MSGIFEISNIFLFLYSYIILFFYSLIFSFLLLYYIKQNVSNIKIIFIIGIIILLFLSFFLLNTVFIILYLINESLLAINTHFYDINVKFLQSHRGFSTRMMATSWWFFCLIIANCYTANLAAFLTVETIVSPFSNVEELARKKAIKYGAKIGGSTFMFFQVSVQLNT